MSEFGPIEAFPSVDAWAEAIAGRPRDAVTTAALPADFPEEIVASAERQIGRAAHPLRLAAKYISPIRRKHPVV